MMRKQILLSGLLLVCVSAASAQQTESRASGQAGTQTNVDAGDRTKNIHIENGTTLAAHLQNSIDVRKAKVGDEVVLKTARAIKSEGKTIVGKGARLIGRVTEVTQKTKADNESRITILFDRLEHNSLTVPISATVTSLTRANTSSSANSNDLFPSEAGGTSSARTTSSGTASGSGGGLVGGVVNSTTSTVGSTVGGATSAVGSTVNSTTNAVSGTATGLNRSLGAIQISQSSSTSVEGGSTLSLQGGNLRLEKGTTFNLVLTQSASAGTRQDQ
jgi:phenylpyruvate tautomerase PptA (4-oxalocrotonate tautomerase family)